MTLTAEQQSYVRAVVSQIEALEAQIADLNNDKSSEYQGAKAKGLDVPLLRKFIALRRKQRDKPGAIEREQDVMTDYEHAMEAEPRARAREEAA